MKAYRLIDRDSKHSDEWGGLFFTKEEAIKVLKRALADHRRQGTERQITELAVYEDEVDDEKEPVDPDIYGKNVFDHFDIYAEELRNLEPPRNYEICREDAVCNYDDRTAVNYLGRWFEENSQGRFWDGEGYDCDEGERLYPVMVPVRDDEGSFEIVGYTFSSDHKDRFPYCTR